jgi:hypothetical protein
MSIEQELGSDSQKIRTIEQAVTVGTRLPISWFRGHAQTYGTLTPTVYRIPPTKRGGYREYWLAERFRLRAGSIHENVPPWNDHVRWLLLMQHHGLPTRLLDWTESILVALYFAVEGPPHEAGEIWCIRPDALNNRSGYFLHSADRPVVKYLASEAFINESDEPKRSCLRQELQVQQSITRNPVAFLPPLEFPRMSAQSSRFTIHPTPAEDNVIQRLLTGPREIMRYEVPSDSKTSLSRDLTALGVTAETLFRSLDALSATIKSEVYTADCGDIYPDPPVFE